MDLVDPSQADDCIEDEEDKEAQEMMASSKVLTEIYGNKIKLDYFWYFENPVVMKEGPPIGQIEVAPKDNNAFDQANAMANFGADYGDEYGEEIPARQLVGK